MILFSVGPSPLGFSVTADDLRVHAILQSGPGLLRLALRGERYDVTLADPDDKRPLAAFVVFDDLTPDRQTAITRFWNALTGKRIPPDPRLTEQRRQRARQMLRAVDARDDGATYRAIAEHLFPHHENDAATWVGSAIRETTIRLTRDGLKLVDGDYRSLLRRPRRDR